MTNPDTTNYDALAWFYDRYWGDFADHVLPILDSLGLADLPPGAPVLDLACGTGRLAAKLAERGFKVTGIDLSPEMLRYAEQNAPGATFVHGDARHFTLDTPVMAVVCTYDSLNHMQHMAELSAVFGRVYTVLQPNGLFLFDLNMEAGYINRWQGTWGIQGDDHAAVIRSSYVPETRQADMWASLFRRLPSTDAYARTDVHFSQRCFMLDHVLRTLREAGFGWAAAYHRVQGQIYPGEGERTFFVARKGTPLYG